MIKKAFSYGALLLVSLSLTMATGCGRSEKTRQEEAPVAVSANTGYAPLEEMYVVPSDVGRALADWQSYWELEKEMKNFRETRSGDLGFITDEIIRIQGTLVTDSMPEKVNIPAVKSRVLVFRTFAQKLKDQLNHRVPVATLDTTRIKIFEAYNAFRFQVSDALREKVFEDFLNRDTLDIKAASSTGD